MGAAVTRVLKRTRQGAVKWKSGGRHPTDAATSQGTPVATRSGGGPVRTPL